MEELITGVLSPFILWESYLTVYFCKTCRLTELRSFNRHYIPGQQDEGALLCWASVFTCQLLSCCDVHRRKTCKNFTEPLAASNNFSKDTFQCVWCHTVSVCSQESQPVTLMLHSSHMGKMGEKRFHFTNIIHISSQVVKTL